MKGYFATELKKRKKETEKNKKAELRKCKKCAFFDAELCFCFGPHRLPARLTDLDAYGEAYLDAYFRRGAKECERFVSKKDKKSCEMREKNKVILLDGEERLREKNLREAEEKRLEEEKKRLEEERIKAEKRARQEKIRNEQERVVRERKKAEFEALLAKAKGGNVAVMCELAECYHAGRGVDKDQNLAKEWLVKAFKAGNTEAEKLMIGFYGEEEANRLKEPIIKEREKKKQEEAQKKEFEALASRAESGNIEAMYQLGMKYLNGVGTKKNIPEAEEWFYKAMQLGNLFAFTELKVLVRGKQNKTPKEEMYAKAISDFLEKREEEERREREEAERQRVLNEQKARLEELKKSAAASAEKSLELARVYLNGYAGVRKSVAGALTLCRKAMELAENDDITTYAKAAEFLRKMRTSENKELVNVDSLEKWNEAIKLAEDKKQTLVRKARNGDLRACRDAQRLNAEFNMSFEVKIEMLVRRYWLELNDDRGLKYGWSNTLDEIWQELERCDRDEYYNRRVRGCLAPEIQADWDRILYDAEPRKARSMERRKQAEAVESAEREEKRRRAEQMKNAKCRTCRWFRHDVEKHWIDDFGEALDSPKVIERDICHRQVPYAVVSPSGKCDRWEPIDSPQRHGYTNK